MKGNVESKGWRGFAWWTGEDGSGQPYPESIYQFSLIANNGEEKVVVPLVSQQKINSVNWDANSQKLKVKLDGEVNYRWNSLVTLKFRTGENTCLSILH